MTEKQSEQNELPNESPIEATEFDVEAGQSKKIAFNNYENSNYLLYLASATIVGKLQKDAKCKITAKYLDVASDAEDVDTGDIITKSLVLADFTPTKEGEEVELQFRCTEEHEAEITVEGPYSIKFKGFFMQDDNLLEEEEEFPEEEDEKSDEKK